MSGSSDVTAASGPGASAVDTYSPDPESRNFTRPEAPNPDVALQVDV